MQARERTASRTGRTPEQQNRMTPRPETQKQAPGAIGESPHEGTGYDVSLTQETGQAADATPAADVVFQRGRSGESRRAKSEGRGPTSKRAKPGADQERRGFVRSDDLPQVGVVKGRRKGRSWQEDGILTNSWGN